jgi:hypothetical protein
LRRYAAVDTIDAATTAAALDVLRAMTSGARDANRRTVYEAGIVPALVLFLRPGEAPAARRAAAATLHNLSTFDVELASMNNGNVVKHDINSGNNGDGLDASALALTRLQDAVGPDK